MQPAAALRFLSADQQAIQALRRSPTLVFLLQQLPSTTCFMWIYDVVYNQTRPRMSTTMTIRLDDDVKDRLDVLAGVTQRSKSFLAAEAIRAFVETNEWQIGEIQAALKEADAGDFAGDKDVAALAKKWKVNAR